MSAIIINQSRIKRRELKNEKGERIGELVYNPNDIHVLDKFWAIYDKMNKGSQRQKQLEIELGRLDVDILEKDLETIDEFVRAGKVIEKRGETIKAAIETWDDMTKGLDDIFGEGTCELFTQGYADERMLDPLIEGVMPDFEAAAEERKKHVDKYKRNRAERRAAKQANTGS